MKKYSIQPNVVRIKQGTLVTLDVYTADVQHGFSVPALGIKKPVQPGKPASITFEADQKGSFKVECVIVCGAGHDDMVATLIVE